MLQHVTIALIIANMLTLIPLLGIILTFAGSYLLASVVPSAMVFACLNLGKNNIRGKTNGNWSLMKVNEFHILFIYFIHIESVTLIAL